LFVYVLFKTWEKVISGRRFAKNGKKCTEIIIAREGRPKVLFLFIKYAKFVALSLPSRRRT